MELTTPIEQFSNIMELVGVAGRACSLGDTRVRLAIGLILNFLGGLLWLYYYDKTAAAPHRATRKVFLPRWVFYAGVECFCVGFYLIIVSMMK